MNATAPSILIIVGITGDLSKRKLLPALARLSAEGALPQQFRIIGITRQKTITLDEILEHATDTELVRPYIELYSMSLTEKEDYVHLHEHVKSLGHALGKPQYLWYLAVPPQTAWPIIERLGDSGLAKMPHTKLLLEKPFGADETSARELALHIEKSFAADAVYRIDHYLAKEKAQEIIVSRQTDIPFEHSLRREHVERVDIIASETIGIEGRSVFYEQTGAIRDVIQSHLMQLAALTMMTLPHVNAKGSIPHARSEFLKTLHVAPNKIFRGQYEGYREEVGDLTSTVETFASLMLFSTDPRWMDVPITLTTGKALAEKKTEIVITYRTEQTHGMKRMVLKIQPTKETDFYGAYEHIFLAALRGDDTFFVSNEEILESWSVIDAARKEWELNPQLISYPQGATLEQVFSAKAS